MFTATLLFEGEKNISFTSVPVDYRQRLSFFFSFGMTPVVVIVGDRSQTKKDAESFNSLFSH
jgi:hypothetical protein